MRKSASPPKEEKPPAQAESELGRRLREIKARIVASGVHLYKNDEEVLREVRARRAGIDTEP